MNICLLESRIKIHRKKAKILSRQRKKPLRNEFNEPCKIKNTQPRQENENHFLIIFESEIASMAAQADLWDNLETGGELYGFLSHDGNLIIMLATHPGENAIHCVTSFQQDILFFKRTSKKLHCKHGLQLLGNFHSHHNLCLKNLSGLDIQNLNTIARKNNFSILCQLLLTFETGAEKKNCYSSTKNHATHRNQFVQVRSYYYPDAINGDPVKCPIRILPGISPIRQAIEKDPDLAEIVKPSHFPLSRIIYDEYKAYPTPKDSIPKPIRDQINIFMENFNESISIVFKDKWIIATIPLSNVAGSLFIAFNCRSPFNIQSIFYQVDSISEKPVNISNEILKNHHAQVSLTTAYDISRNLITTHFAEKSGPYYDTH